MRPSPTLADLPPPPPDRTGWPWTAETPHVPASQPDGTPWPRISIVTPSYNQARYLEAAIRSVLDQGYPNLQYILIDGASTDGSAAIIAKYKDRIDWCVSEPDKGHGDALNKGFARADGEIMAWLNSDDMYLPWTFATVAQIFGLFPDVDWIEGNPSNWDAHGRLLNSASRQINRYDYLLGRYGWIQQESVFWRRKLWDQAGGYIDTKYRFMVDGELWSRFFLWDDLVSVKCILGGYRSHGQNRAALFESTCLQEMADILATLQKNVDSESLMRTRLYQRTFWATWPLRNMRLRAYVTKRILGSALRPLDYRVIAPVSGTWQLERIAFR